MKNIYELISEALDKELAEAYGYPLNEMAQDRKGALLTLEHLEDTYFEHLCKAVLYKNSTNNLYHWLGEIAQCLSDVNNIILKLSNNKLDPETIEAKFLLARGDSLREYEIHIDILKKRLFKKYPKIQITQELIEEVFTTFIDLNDFLKPILASKNNHDKEWFRNKLVEYFED